MFWGHKKASSLEHLVRLLKIDTIIIQATVEAYNTAIINEENDLLRKLNHRSVISTGPFYGLDISFKRSGVLMASALTLGGLRVDSVSGIVLNETGYKISRLYTAGGNAAGICSKSYVLRLSLADCVFSGKRAGEHVAKSKE